MKINGQLKELLILILMGWMGFAQAQEEVPRASWDATKTQGTYTLDADHVLAQPVILTGDLTINAGNGPHTIHRRFNDAMTSGFSGMFITLNHKLTINGTHEKKITIDGGAVYNTPGDARTGFKSGYKGRCIMVETGGSLVLNHVNIQNAYANDALPWPGYEGAGIMFKQESGTYLNSTLTNTIIRGCHACLGSAVKFSHRDYTNATFTAVYVYNCKTDPVAGGPDSYTGGTIRSNGSCRSKLTMDNCEVHHNETINGGGILWNAGGAADTKLTVKGNTRIHDNVATGSGGGIHLNTKLDLQSAEIYNNNAVLGGGIAIEPYGTFNEYMEGYGVNLTITSQVTIRNNVARDLGGGILLSIIQSDEVGFNQQGQVIANPNHTFDMQGGVITGNSARQGAGIAIRDNAAKKNVHNGVQSNEAKR